MKTSIKPVKPEFQPVTIEITFESAEELHLIRQVLKSDLRVPMMLRSQGDLENENEKRKLTGLMTTIHDALFRKKGQ